ncbi:Cellulose synthase-like protein D2 [Ananas comosus]|uniref:Cellulose synthase-like protein D2 n=1 Tax=Ananas comosus TaxID=4615 RepID=A0A199UP68_ANACO|nr:Cellulose synthase-like protein D2 [Ananas comosus]
MDRGGDRLCYVQFPQRFEVSTPRPLRQQQHCLLRRQHARPRWIARPRVCWHWLPLPAHRSLRFDPPRARDHSPSCCSCCLPRRGKVKAGSENSEETRALRMGDADGDEVNLSSFPKKFGNSSFLIDSIPVAEFQGRPLADHPPSRTGDRLVHLPFRVRSSMHLSEDRVGQRVGWIYGSVTEDVVTGYRMHNRGWKSVYCVTQRDAFRGTAPINLTDRLHQVLRWATGSVEIFFSRNNALLASSKMKLLQRVAYLNVGIYPFTSIFLIVYCFLPALSLFSGQFIVQTLNVTFLTYLLVITLTLCMLAMLEIKWSGIELEEWWRNEQFWLIGGTSAHLAAWLLNRDLLHPHLQSAGDDEEDDFAELYIVKWTSLMIPPLTIIMVNLIAIAVGFSRTIYSSVPQWSKLLGGVFFSFWVLAHLYPFAKGLMGRRGRTPTIVYVWSGLVAITISLLWVAIKPPSSASSQIGGSFTFP